MNKREVIEKIKNDNSLTGGLVEKSWAIYCIEQIHEPQKPVVPNFVAEWIETHKRCMPFLSHLFTDNLDEELKEWLDFSDNQNLIAKAWIYGYTVETEKLYTVEIPNPNGDSNRYGLCKVDGKIIIGSFMFGLDRATNAKLTESEIKQDFDFLWKFAVPVEEN